MDSKMDLLLKRDAYRHSNKFFCNMKEEQDKISEFLESSRMKSLLVKGPQNTGKTLVVKKVLIDTSTPYEYVLVLKDFIESDVCTSNLMNMVVYVIDDFDKTRLHYTKKKKFNSILKNKKSTNKIIVIGRDFDKKFIKNFDMVIKTSVMNFDTVLRFLKTSSPDLANGLSDKSIEEAYHEVQGDINHLLNYLFTGINNKRKDIDIWKDNLRLTSLIFTENNRKKVFVELMKVLSLDYIIKRDLGKKLKYSKNLDRYLVFNIPIFFDPTEKAFYHNCEVLSSISRKKKDRKLGNYSLVKILSNRIMVSAKKNVKPSSPYGYGKIKKRYKK
jgi:hypothetical protein